MRWSRRPWSYRGVIPVIRGATPLWAEVPPGSNDPVNQPGGGEPEPPVVPNINIDNVTVAEGGVATFTVTLSAATTVTVTVAYASSDGSALAGTDYTAVSGTLTFTAGQTSQSINVTIAGDAIDEANETFFINLSNPTNATIADAQGTGTITDDDAQPSLSINDITVNENAGTATFTVTLSAASGLTVTVGWATASGTATAGSDFTAASGTLTFTAGQTTKTIDITILNDADVEAAEVFYVDLSGPTNATISDSRGQCTINSEDVFANGHSLDLDGVTGGATPAYARINGVTALDGVTTGQTFHIWFRKKGVCQFFEYIWYHGQATVAESWGFALGQYNVFTTLDSCRMYHSNSAAGNNYTDFEFPVEVVSDDGWHLLSASYEPSGDPLVPGEVLMWLDGDPCTNLGGNPPVPGVALRNSSSPIIFGVQHGPGGFTDYPYQGLLDEPTIYNFPSNDAMVAAYYAAGGGVNHEADSGLLVWHRWEETGDDSSGNGHTATLHNAATYSTDHP